MIYKLYYFEFLHFAGGVETENGIIKLTAPCVGKFLGQPIENLEKWLKSKGGLLKEIT